MNGITNLDILEAAFKCCECKPWSCKECPLLDYIKCKEILQFCLKQMRDQTAEEFQIVDDELITAAGLYGKWTKGGGRFA